MSIRTLQIEVAKPFSVSDGRSDDRILRPILVLAGGKAPTKKRCENIVSVFLVGGEETISEEKCAIAESIPNGRAIVVNIGREIENDFNRSRTGSVRALFHHRNYWWSLLFHLSATDGGGGTHCWTVLLAPNRQ